MKAILEDRRTGKVGSYDVPVPELRRGGVLVRTAFSAISSGTERASVETSEKSLFAKAMARPDLVRQVVDLARTSGVKSAYQTVKTRLDTLSPMGYSCSGVVIGVGEGVTEFQPGDRVACAGATHANHCEVNWVPVNLAVRVPDTVSLEAASLTTIGAIAMQGLRQAQVAFGETVVVIGAGLVGILTILQARAAGCRVIAIDLDPARVEKATSLGAHLALLASDPGLPQAVAAFSRYGADAAIVTAATRSAEPLELAAKILRDRGRVVVVGDVGMGVSRRDLYHKEVTLAMSRSYGPGRYDPSYEENGIDYPVGYVRWTERRNMEAFLDFLASGSVDVSALLQQRYRADDGERAYSELLSGQAYTAILEYGEIAVQTSPQLKVVPAARLRANRLKIGCIGAGGCAQTHILPNLKGMSEVSLETVATASGVTAESARLNFGFARAGTASELLADADLNAIFITSRNSSHREYVIAGLQQGKSVFVEKPLALDEKQLGMIEQAYEDALDKSSRPFLMVGFNRRFAPATEKIRAFFADRHEPMMVHARINAGFLPSTHWTQHQGEGGRIVGEFCHFVDWARSVVGSPIRTVSATALPDNDRYNGDNISVTLTFADRSIANLLYLANGDPAVPKEYFEVFCEGSVARLEDFETLQLTRGRKTKRSRSARDKGHRREIQLTVQSMLSGKDAPIPFAELVEVTKTTFLIAKAIATGQTLTLVESVSPAASAGNSLRTAEKEVRISAK
jgi:predicted dehydrogenase/threonine dehydrogenase-like Zn-dependent dehydrogenase